MTTAQLLLVGSAGGGAVLFAVAAVRSLRRPLTLRAVVRAHGVLPAGLAPVVLPLVPYGELAAAGSLVLGLSASGALRTPLLAAFSAWAAAYAVYLLLVLRRGTGTSCGCLGSTEPVNAVHVARPALIALSGVLLAVSPPAVTSAPDTVAAVALSGFCALLYRHAPTALAGVGPAPGQRGSG